jgi:hypothetical protein
MDKCFACANDATCILPCYHKVCDICLNDLIRDSDTDSLVCLCYPEDDCDKQCLNSFKKEEVLPITNDNDIIQPIEVCLEHYNQYTKVCKCDRVYCDTCNISCGCGASHIYSVEYWKQQVLIKIEKHHTILNSKINGLKCIYELIRSYSKEQTIKQIEDIIDTFLVDKSHIDNFNKLINDLPISNIVKTKNKILSNNIIIPPMGDITSSIKDKLSKSLINSINSIIDNGANIDYNNDWILRLASEYGNLTIVECLTKYGADVHADNDYALRRASHNGHLAVVKCLIENNASINANNGDSLKLASINGHIDIVKYLIEHDAYIHIDNESALIHASLHGRLDIVELLISHGADVNACNGRALQGATKRGHLAVVECLKVRGAIIQ